jgi:hypothetical protein
MAFTQHFIESRRVPAHPFAHTGSDFDWKAVISLVGVQGRFNILMGRESQWSNVSFTVQS